MTMKYHNITHDDLKNGDGIRVVLWVAGCEHHCKGCQNPMTWNPDDGKEFGSDELKEICTELSKDYVAGITFSGGDPLHPQNFMTIETLICYIKKQFPHKTIWLYTGYTWEEIVGDKELTEAVKDVDVLVEGRFNESLFDSSYHWAGSTNQRIINAKESMKKGKVIFHESN